MKYLLHKKYYQRGPLFEIVSSEVVLNFKEKGKAEIFFNILPKIDLLYENVRAFAMLI
ncbi:putative uncharacterized protein [Tetragenococcus halophilus subsp. halophilus]|uniref:Uncharacterized protein n=1 Tax=Tetragenococcus halophilus (strain DSM 20338 / JCM 20259 / NCIMB 9735 / NBRC 12172) TaxID=945021 RepID=A0AAN1VQY2_TETHN|nr:hypothetical protein TEH_11460 [Tetragenococcus halophilus NBRC 12172]GBD59493.1 putative uncharacterized protein [Tetragenococcus halophilus subsp. halophilus]GFK21688.1 hypothetical protein WJ7_11510 [Tetragenococcus halophilus]GMA43140.1 hypothetical protein GCM10025853_05970 [Tetragenococcus halophilus subsp. halophilus DSM 20339]GBD62274.1 putative uncharacterized protein [Tetragenococcus halophilus subsp. halophilus]